MSFYGLTKQPDPITKTTTLETSRGTRCHVGISPGDIPLAQDLYTAATRCVISLYCAGENVVGHSKGDIRRTS